MVNQDGWSERKKTLHRYLKRAFDENRGAEAILLWQWRKAIVAHENEQGVAAMKKFDKRNAGQPKAIRALNLIEEKNGSGVSYTYEAAAGNTKKTMIDLIMRTPEDQRIVLPPSDFNGQVEEVKRAYEMACEAVAAHTPVITVRRPIEYAIH